MTSARIFFDNEREAGKYSYPHFRYDGSLLPLERGTAIVNGKLADAAIHIFREPPLISFAKQRKQITTLDIRLLQAPVSKTDANLLIQDYLLERISRAKNAQTHKSKKENNEEITEKKERILLKTLYEHTDATTKKQRQRVPEKLHKYLKFYTGQGFIARYTIDKNGITIYWE